MLTWIIIISIIGTTVFLSFHFYRQMIIFEQENVDLKKRLTEIGSLLKRAQERKRSHVDWNDATDKDVTTLKRDVEDLENDLKDLE